MEHGDPADQLQAPLSSLASESGQIPQPLWIFVPCVENGVDLVPFVAVKPRCETMQEVPYGEQLSEGRYDSRDVDVGMRGIRGH